MKIGLSAPLIAASCLGLPTAISQVHTAADAQHSGSTPTGATERVHTERTFGFTVKAPMELAAPLFGADKERAWAPGWDPSFVWPVNVKDQQGTVFTVTRGERKSVWITTANDPVKGLFQYAYVTPDVVATLITVNLTPHGSSTHAEVRYERTALNVAANDMVQKMADHDSQSGPEWETQINDYLAASRK